MAVSPEQNKTSTVVKQFVVDFSSETYKPLMEHEVNGLDYRYVYSDKARLSVVVQGIENGSASLLDSNGELHAYYHCDYLGTTDYLTSAVNSKVISWTSYNEWGEITHNAVLKCGQRELDLVKEYATHDFDAVLNMYYAKARFYDADNRRFTAVDPIKDGLNWYAYCGSNPVNYIDPWGYAANPYDNIDWSKIGTYKKGKNTYYSTQDIFAQLNVKPDYNKGTKQVTLSYSYNDKTVKLIYNMNNIVTDKYGRVINGKSFTGTLSGGGTAKAVTLIYANKKAYISQEDVKNYFKLVWCEGKATSSKATQNLLVTAEQLREIGFANVTDPMVAELNYVLQKYDITTPERIRHFLAQCCHESMGGQYLTERNWSKKDWWNDDITNDKLYFNNKYSNRGKGSLGNEGGDDGYTYRGAGYIQLTGRWNYQQFANDISGYNTPQFDSTIYDAIMNGGANYVAENYAWAVAGYFWKQKNINSIVDAGGTVADVLKVVNLYDSSSLTSRETYYNKACEVIK